MRNKLEFERLDDAVAYIETLLKDGYEQSGKWNLGQCCEHLNYWITFPVEGFPNPGPFMGTVMWLMKVTVGQSQLRSILENGFKDGIPTMPTTVVASVHSDDQQSFKKLRASIQRFMDYDGPIAPSPLFGELSKDVATKLQLRHFEHHLSFLTSKAV